MSDGRFGGFEQPINEESNLEGCQAPNNATSKTKRKGTSSRAEAGLGSASDGHQSEGGGDALS